jgi:hypothetical protein
MTELLAWLLVLCAVVYIVILRHQIDALIIKTTRHEARLDFVEKVIKRMTGT